MLAPGLRALGQTTGLAICLCISLRQRGPCATNGDFGRRDSKINFAVGQVCSLPRRNSRYGQQAMTKSDWPLETCPCWSWWSGYRPWMSSRAGP